MTDKRPAISSVRESGTAFIAAARALFTDDDVAALLPAIGEVLRSGRLILGPQTEAFETRFRDYVGAAHAVAVSSCSAALRIALRFYGAQDRDVILPTNNFPGVVSIVLQEGGTPVLVDINADTFCADTEDLLARISSRTAGVVIPHIAGLIYPDIDRVRKECDRQGVFLIEDAAQAHGAALDGRRAGSLTETACFSFYPTKNMTTGTGGMITTANADLAAFAKSLRHHGQGSARNLFEKPGDDWCLSEIHALLGLVQLDRLDERVAHRNAIARCYRERLADTDWITVPSYDDRFLHAYFKLPMLLHEDIDAGKFRTVLEEEFGIQNGTLYDPPCHRQPVFQHIPAIAGAHCPVADATLRRQFCPPIHALISEQDVTTVIEAMHAVRARV